MATICEAEPFFPELPDLSEESTWGRGSPIPCTPSPWGSPLRWSSLRSGVKTPSPTWPGAPWHWMAPAHEDFCEPVQCVAPQPVHWHTAYDPAPAAPTTEEVVAVLMAEAEQLALTAAAFSMLTTPVLPPVPAEATGSGSGPWMQEVLAAANSDDVRDGQFAGEDLAARICEWRGGEAPRLQQAAAGAVAAVVRAAARLASDRFGKDAVLAVVENGTLEQRAQVVQALEGRWVSLSIDVNGCRVVQRLLEVGPEELRFSAVVELAPHLESLVDHKYGNHVAHRIVEHCAPATLGLLVPVVQEGAGRLARHAYGCRVLQKLMERCPLGVIAGVAAEIASDPTLATHAFGNYVVQCIVKHSSADLRWAVARAVCDNLEEYCDNKFASNVVEAVVRWCPEAADLVVDAAMGSSAGLVGLSSLRYGNFVVQRLLVARGRSRPDLVEALQSGPRLQGFGKHVQAALNRMNSSK